MQQLQDSCRTAAEQLHPKSSCTLKLLWVQLLFLPTGFSAGSEVLTLIAGYAEFSFSGTKITLPRPTGSAESSGWN